ncbi:MAG: toll/interleukin-1 receptor domain-containing protein, partial [Erysipelotrichaceae bacterium]|nr:toll/interleukin-1 receptor domain-containing protein [Erysipelotrichaceae bacterium]
MAEKVFISYSHQDSICAHGIARYLARHGCDVWIDSKNLSLGDAWASDIEAALRSANVVVAILSSSSLRRPEVLKEINISLKRMNEEGMENCRVFFVVVGQIHPSWFKDEDSIKAIRDYLLHYQYIELSAYGEVTLDAMKSLLSAIKGKGIEEGSLVLTSENMDEGFINQNSEPEKSFDNLGNNVYYKVYAADLAPSCIYPFALDNQWLPEIFYDKSSQQYLDFEKEGFCSPRVQEYIKEFKKRNFSFAFFHYKQTVIKLNTFLYEPYFVQLIKNESEDLEAFKKLLANGSIVVLLNDTQTTPF